jgi:hypothetical protein
MGDLLDFENAPLGPGWQGDEARDFLIFRLVDLADRVAGWFFMEGAVDEYRAWLKSTSRRKGKSSTATHECAHWNDAEDGFLKLHALPRKAAFQLWFGNTAFDATVAFSFDDDDRGIVAAAVKNFAGSTTAAIEAIESWRDYIDDIGYGFGTDCEVELEELAEFIAGPADRKQGRNAEPPEANTEDARQVQMLAKSVAARFAKGKRTELHGDGKSYVESRPQCLWLILDGALAAFGATRRDDHLVSTYLYLLTHQLSTFRFRLETGVDWAKPLLDRFQARIASLAAGDDLAPEDCTALANTLVEAKVEVDDIIGEALMNRAAAEAPLPGTEQDIAAALRPMLDQMAASVDDSFDLLDALNEAIAIMPAPVRAVITFELGLSHHAILRDAVPLLLLDAQKDVRHAAVAALEQTAAPATLSPVALRRMILLRNWVPEQERDALDRTIRKAREAGVVRAPWPETRPPSMLASVLDGAGTSSIIFSRRSGKSGLFSGLLLKLGFGVRDVWLDADRPDKDIMAMIATMRRESGAFDVRSTYVDLVVGHHRSLGLTEGNFPAPAMIAVAEAAGGAAWKPAQIDLNFEIARLAETLGPAAFTEKEVAASLKRSTSWFSRPFGQSWFEDNPDIRAIAESKSKPEKATERALNQSLESRRLHWATHFLLMAARSEAAMNRKDAGDFVDFLIMARELAMGTPLADIPFMLGQAYRSVAIAQQTA